MGHKDKVDLFDLLIGEIDYSVKEKLNNKEVGILHDSINRFSKKEFGKEWEATVNDTWNKRQDKHQQVATKNYLSTKFNPGLKKLLKDIVSYYGNKVFVIWIIFKLAELYGINLKISVSLDHHNKLFFYEKTTIHNYSPDFRIIL